MTNTYLTLIRGINVGGNNIVKMDLLRKSLEKQFTDVKTYIQSGNLIFDSKETSIDKINKSVQQILERDFNVIVDVVTLTKKDWKKIIESAPKQWGRDQDWKYNIFVLIDKTKVKETIDEIGELKQGIEFLEKGNGVLYQGVLIEQQTKSTFMELPKKKVYKQMTIRNYNTATKLLSLLED